jgi:predicted transcriptional regulator
MPTQAPHPAPANVTIKLDMSHRDRLKSLAIAKRRTSHYLMKEAISRYLEEEERELQWVRAAEVSLENYDHLGSHVTLDEVRTWAKDVQKNRNTPIPLCHK